MNEFRKKPEVDLPRCEGLKGMNDAAMPSTEGPAGNLG